MKAILFILSIAATGLSNVAHAEDGLVAQDDACFNSAQRIYDGCTKQAKSAGGLNDENHHSCLSKYHEKIDSCLLPE